MTCTFRLVTVDGTPADPPSLTTVASKWEAGDTIPLGRKTLRVIGVRADDPDALPVLVRRGHVRMSAERTSLCASGQSDGRVKLRLMSARGRASAVQQWLVRRADTPIERLGVLWFRRYFESSQNSGCAATLYGFLSVGPLLLAATGLLHAAGSDTNAFAQRLVEHNGLTGETASLVSATFGTASENAVAASVTAVIGFLLWGIGIGQIYQDVYARAWRVQVRTLSDQARFTVWFFVLSGLLGLFVVFSGHLRDIGWLALIPVWMVFSTAFWLWTGRYLLHGLIGWRALLPGALLASLIVGGAIATSRFFLGPWLNSDGKHFGSFGVVGALLAWGFILVTLSTVSAVFSPVWAEWRKNEQSA